MKTIVVLENDRTVLDIVRWALQGYRILRASTPDDAVEQVCGGYGVCDLLIAPPIGPLVETALRLRSINAHLKLLLISRQMPGLAGRDSATLRRAGSECVGVIDEPLVPAVLAHKVHELIGPPQPVRVFTAA